MYPSYVVTNSAQPRHYSTVAGATRVLSLALCCLLQACATQPIDVAERVGALLPADVILLGEQHDAPDHQALERAVVLELARREQLAALAMEMAEQGRSTQGLARDATQAEVQLALRWTEAGWPWANYGPVVMAAVRSGVPVLGANLARDAMRSAMADESLDRRLEPAALGQQRDNIRGGHCMLLPENQIAPMTRIQIARDAAMAQTAATALKPGKAVLLVAGGGHVLRGLGVPTHLPLALRTRVVLAVAGQGDQALRSGADVVWETPAVPPVDHCAELEQRAKP